MRPSYGILNVSPFGLGEYVLILYFECQKSEVRGKRNGWDGLTNEFQTRPIPDKYQRPDVPRKAKGKRKKKERKKERNN